MLALMRESGGGGGGPAIAWGRGSSDWGGSRVGRAGRDGVKTAR